MASELKLRRTLALPSDRRADLEQIKDQIGARTDTCAMNYVIKLGAYLATRKLGMEDLHRAIWLAEQIEQRTRNGGRVFIQDGTHEPRLIELVIPPPSRADDDYARVPQLVPHAA